MNQCSLIVNWSLRNKLRWNFNQNTKLFVHKNASEKIVCEMVAILFRRRWVKMLHLCRESNDDQWIQQVDSLHKWSVMCFHVMTYSWRNWQISYPKLDIMQIMFHCEMQFNSNNWLVELWIFFTEIRKYIRQSIPLVYLLVFHGRKWFNAD